MSGVLRAFFLCRESVTDCISEFCFHFIGVESCRPVSNLSLAIKNYDSREGVDGEETVETIRKDNCRAGFFFLEIGRNESFVFVAIRGEKNDVRDPLELRGHVLEVRL